ncbi:MAG: Methylase involved in ubiquinone/menaquinone biosynthesis [Candidatus Woesebacteria bacterium GW2011_GWB1_38_5b]|uniref:Methylase involved in ubiquinone/menaquinone biosynthesis n=1 Tax=Candidatus Woesebacteria bacterium GW2011_GWB1_38_5b TaxID=1618569 RepID=A0A0G0MPX1_9BACT|nr:MAG: Methylase involved in ubiquinone/menaquinone biosynthesis [Candidatus Woesebacteria bacterium GW2011_GWB1_38_5b]
MKCVLCGFNKFDTLFEVSQKSVIKCRNCDLVRLKGNFSISYNHYYRDSDYHSYDRYFKNIFYKRYKFIAKYTLPGKVLDVGASTGIFLEIFKDHGWEVRGVEPSSSAEVAQRKGIKMYRTQFEKLDLEKNNYDLIILNHSLEHVRNPLAFMKKVKGLLKKNGVVYVEVPNFASLESMIAKKAWRYLLPNEHIYQFTPETLGRLIEAVGLKVVSNKTYAGLFALESLFFHFKFQLTSGRKHFYKNFIIDLLTLPIDMLSLALDKGSALAIIAQR